MSYKLKLEITEISRQAAAELPFYKKVLMFNPILNEFSVVYAVALIADKKNKVYDHHHFFTIDAFTIDAVTVGGDGND